MGEIIHDALDAALNDALADLLDQLFDRTTRLRRMGVDLGRQPELLARLLPPMDDLIQHIPEEQLRAALLAVATHAAVEHCERLMPVGQPN